VTKNSDGSKKLIGSLLFYLGLFSFYKALVIIHNQINGADSQNCFLQKLSGIAIDLFFTKTISSGIATTL